MTQTIDGYVAVAMLPVVALVAAVSLMVARRSGASVARLMLAGMSVGVILAVTLFGRMLQLEQWGSGSIEMSWLTDGPLWSQVFEFDREWALNAALFAPAGFVLTWASGRASSVAAGLALLALVIEIVQRWLMLGASDPGDLIANVVGAGCGIVAALVVAASGRRGPGFEHTDP